MKKKKTPFLLKLVQWVYPKMEKTIPPLAHRFFVTIFFTPLNYGVPHKEKAIEKAADKFTVAVAGKKIQCYSWGDGPPVLLVHGWAGRATQFRKMIPALVGEKFRVIGFDGPAHGRSQGRSTNIREFEEALRKICDRTGEPEAIIAHSFGGGAVLYAAMNGLRVKKLINIAAPTIGDEIIHTYLKTINGSPGTAKFFKSYIHKTTGRPFEEFTGLHFIRNIKQDMELLLVHDENDTEVSLNHALEMLKSYPRATLFRTRGLGHTRILKDEEVIKKCVAFINAPPA
ncbi:MAG: alpha/beta fold hydrolase [Cyclobacteriaceae bacterium]